MRIFIGFIALLAALYLLIQPYAAPYFYEKELQSIQQVTVAAEQIQQNIETARVTLPSSDAFNFEQVSVLDTSKKPTPILPQEVVGYIRIPSVSLDLPIMLGLSEEVLLKAAGTMKENMQMGQGNYALAGHHSRKNTLLFAPLHRVKMQDIIYLTDLSTTYTYEVQSIERLDPSRGDVILDSYHDDHILTLVTCATVDGIDRLVIQASLINIQKEDAS